jgi:hypothetical protein
VLANPPNEEKLDWYPLSKKNHHQHKPQRLMGAVQVKASSTKGRDLASPEPGLGQEQ